MWCSEAADEGVTSADSVAKVALAMAAGALCATGLLSNRVALHFGDKLLLYNKPPAVTNTAPCAKNPNDKRVLRELIGRLYLFIE